jgi:hypothetical protein
LSNKFLIIFQAVGHDIEKGLPYVIPPAVAAGPIVTGPDPALGAIFSTVVGIVASTKQKYAAIGKQSGTGTLELTEVLQIASPTTH